MKNYAPENAYFKLPFQFDPKSLMADLQKCLQYDFLKNYVPANYNGDNYILPLRSINGKINIPAAVPHSAEKYENTIALEACKNFQHVIETFQCDKEAVRLMNLPPGAIVNIHTDFNCGYEDGVFRIHIPIETNEQVTFILNDNHLQMRSGEVWYTNVNLPHGVKNLGNTNRVHLVMDCIRNEWSDRIFKDAGFDFNLEQKEKEKLPMHVLLRVIEELEMKNDKDSKSILERLKKEHGIV